MTAILFPFIGYKRQVKVHTIGEAVQLSQRGIKIEINSLLPVTCNIEGGRR